MAKVLGFDHVSIIVEDAERALAFYQGVLGLQSLDRPNLGFPGYWLDLMSGQSLHIMQLPNPNEKTTRPAHGGRDYHFALRVDSITEYEAFLQKNDLVYTKSKSGRKALFIKDLDNNAFELFEA
ncbi:VOC family protein [Hydrogenovibrio sp. 3SP14C1]|uniref:VOC family protein n=1 Tax=Hydrogenovibrio sp. 3SP14C1 TaxID=3038774 RepID=UPI002417DA62|nr:VOC family protein [Hydrogenovibrio sp. 3SP14C1]MDG4812849.1 VOC family protein [Hydrogenovibrio sp. 3SP14C1]